MKERKNAPSLDEIPPNFVLSNLAKMVENHFCEDFRSFVLSANAFIMCFNGESFNVLFQDLKFVCHSPKYDIHP